MTFSTPELTLAEVLALARRLGYDGIEPRLASRHKHGIELDTTAAARHDIRQQVAKSGVKLACLATSCRYADPATAKQNIEDTRKAVDLAADVGATRLRVFGGPIPKTLTREKAIEQVADSLLAAADHAHRRGVTLCVETHDDWCNPEHMLAVMMRASHPAVAVNWDIMHPITRGGATMDSAFQTLKAWVRHVHFHDGGLRDGKLVMLPIGQGIIDHKRAVQLLKGAGYTGYLSGEWINWADPYEVHLPRELKAMKGFE
jgi:sugar phosphate isomerase/epimerase